MSGDLMAATSPKGWVGVEESSFGSDPGGWVRLGAPKYEAMHSYQY